MSNTLKFGNGEWYGKKDTILAYNDENSNFKPLPFSFDRASSATVVNKDGLIETVGSGEPRIDYKDDSKGALLLEPSRSNLLTYSEQLDNGSGWINQLGGTVIGNQNGVGNSLAAWKLNKGSGTFKSLRFQSTLSSANYTLSWYLKKGSLDVVEVRFDGGASAQFIDFNLSTGVAGANSALTNIKMELINNGWYRCQASFNSALTNVHLYLGDASSTTEEGYVYAQSPQLEQGSYATSYVPSSGGVVTRVQDVCTNGNLNVDYSGDYTLYLEHETLSLTEYNQFQFRQETSISYIFRVGNSLNIGTNLYTAANTIGFNKFALSVTSIGSYKFYKNGVLLSSGSGLNANLETLKSDALGMNIKEIKLYNNALTDQELINLTTI